MSTFRALRADCARCCGLCCAGPAFDAQQGFGYDKPPHVPCVHLQADSRCGIHALRAEHGFTACAGFDCHGAGQWVSQQLFAGRTWRESPALASAMFSAYSRHRSLHELLRTLDVARRVLPATDTAVVARLDAIVRAACDGEARQPGVTDLPGLRRTVLHQLRMQIGTIRIKMPTDPQEGP